MIKYNKLYTNKLIIKNVFYTNQFKKSWNTLYSDSFYHKRRVLEMSKTWIEQISESW